LRTVSARIKGDQPGPEASIRKILADEHGQRTMALAKDLTGSEGMLSAADEWGYGFLFAPALTVGGGTGEVQRNIVAERVLGLPHDTDVEAGRSWAEANTASSLASAGR
jgi:alkylation response protein AidB-like acyl-CoA dehydrogenase